MAEYVCFVAYFCHNLFLSLGSALISPKDKDLCRINGDEFGVAGVPMEEPLSYRMYKIIFEEQSNLQINWAKIA